jgi:ATPase subunit of ABC transporter with duplicated ATPase domains
LLNLLTGALMPDIGEVRLGTNLAQVILDQRRETLDPEQSLTEVLTGGSGDTVTVGGHSRHVIGYMKDFLFLRADPYRRWRALRRRASVGKDWRGTIVARHRPAVGRKESANREIAFDQQRR